MTKQQKKKAKSFCKQGFHPKNKFNLRKTFSIYPTAVDVYSTNVSKDIAEIKNKIIKQSFSVMIYCT